MNTDELLNILKSEGYKITSQRKAIIETLISNRDNLISAERLFNNAKELYPKTNMSTIYRNLEVLEELNLLYKVVGDDGTALYKLACSKEEHHHHIICKKCGKTEIIDFCPIDVFTEISNEKHFNLTGHKLELYGQCYDCDQKSKKSN